MEKFVISQKYLRGQVYIIREDDEMTEAIINTGSHLIYKSRPWLLLSVNTNHCTSSTDVPIIAAPLTTGNNPFVTPYDIMIEHEGKEATLLLTQIRTIDSRNICQYKYTVPDSLMEEIGKRLVAYLGFGDMLKTMAPNFDLTQMRCFNEPNTKLPEEKPTMTHAVSVSKPVVNPADLPTYNDILRMSKSGNKNATVDNMAKPKPVENKPKEEPKPAPVLHSEKPETVSAALVKRKLGHDPVLPKQTSSGKHLWDMSSMKDFDRLCECISESEICKLYRISADNINAYRHIIHSRLAAIAAMENDKPSQKTANNTIITSTVMVRA